MTPTTLAFSVIAALASTSAAAQSDHRHDAVTEQAQADHSTMDHSKMDHSKMDHSKMDHSKMDHSKMDHSTMDHGDQVAPSQQAVEPIPVLTDADRAAAFPPVHPHAMADNAVHSYLQLGRLERTADASGALAWQATGWLGTDLNRLWLRSEGERVDGRTDHADVELLYGHSVAPWWDVVAGVRQDFAPGSGQTWAAFGVQGLAPYKFEVEATLYVASAGRTAARVEIAYEGLLSNRWILQPTLQATLYGQEDARRGVGSGLSSLEAGLRLRYEFHRQFAPYIGFSQVRTFGDTATLRREAGDSRTDSQFVVGLRTWF